MKKRIGSLVIFLLTTGLIFAQTTIDDLQKKLNSIAENETKAVVFISTEKTIKQRNQNPFFDPFSFFFDERNQNNNREPQEREFKQSGLGSGFVYEKKGDDYFIITNNHVIDGADKIKITIDNSKFYDATVVGADPYVDVAIIKVNTKDQLKIIKAGTSSVLKAGDFVVAIGNPFGLSHSITFGIISALGRSDIDNNKSGFTNFIQTDAAINPGNSGGPLINMDGEVIGINTMIYSQSGGNIGIGFAIPIDIAKNVAKQLINKGKIEHGWIGISFQELDSDKLEKLGVKGVDFGMLVAQVIKNGPADKAGLKTGDVLTKINNTQLKRSSDLTVTIGNSSPGDSISVTFVRNGSTLMKYITIGSRNSADAENKLQKDNQDGAAADSFGFTLKDTKNGVMIDNIDPQSRASQAGFRKGDVIFKINNTEVKSTKDFNNATKNLESPSYFFVDRDGETIIIIM